MSARDVLKEIVAKKKERIEAAKAALALDQLRVQLEACASTRPFIAAISKPKQLALIAEIKKASPSRGVIREDFSPAAIAQIYEEVGVQAISVLTEEDFFLGSPAYLAEVRAHTSVPLLRKDFIVDEYQVYESRLLGADAILLIADVLTKDQITAFKGIADSLGMDTLVEVHEEKQLKKVLSLKVPLIGINNRDLRTLETNFKTTETLFPLIPRDKVVVVESGISSSQDVLFLKILGASAVLVGEAFMSAPDIRKAVEGLMGW
jgi:indole-3-glycerol phosphate synthase